MSSFYDSTPSSLRKPMETSRFAYGLRSHSNRPLLMAAATRLTALSKSRFARLPQEPEDARITGVTRSLQRRLLALNLSGSVGQVDAFLESKIA